MTYMQMGNELSRRLTAICPGIEFRLVGDFNNKDAIKQSLRFPPGTGKDAIAAAVACVEHFEGLHTAGNQ
jgi:hypothetical protein